MKTFKKVVCSNKCDIRIVYRVLGVNIEFLPWLEGVTGSRAASTDYPCS